MRKLDACSTHCSSPGEDHVASFHAAFRHRCDELEFLAKVMMPNRLLRRKFDSRLSRITSRPRFQTLRTILEARPRGNNHNCVEKQYFTRSSQYHSRHLAARSCSSIFLPVTLRVASGLGLSAHSCSRTSVSPIHSSLDIGKM